MENSNFKNIKKKIILNTWTNAPVEFELIVCGSQALSYGDIQPNQLIQDGDLDIKSK